LAVILSEALHCFMQGEAKNLKAQMLRLSSA
jgi:hypothetical protein